MQKAVDYVIGFFLFCVPDLVPYFWPAVALAAIAALIVFMNL